VVKLGRKHGVLPFPLELGFTEFEFVLIEVGYLGLRSGEGWGEGGQSRSLQPLTRRAARVDLSLWER